MENELVQGSAAWHEFRSQGLGASDAPAIMEVSPWKTKYTLFLEKTGLKPPASQNKFMVHGIQTEGPAREWANRELGMTFKPSVRKHNTLDFLYASLDGITDSNIAIEIKCPMKGLHNKVPDHYYPQVQHQLMIIDAPMMYYMSFDGSIGHILEVKRDDSYIEKLIEEEKAFWHCVSNFIEPELSEKDYVKRLDIEYIEKLNEFIKHKDEMEKYKDLCEKAKAELLEMTDGNTLSNGYKITQRSRAGNIDYKSLTKDLLVDDETIQKYRKQGSIYWDIRNLTKT